MVDAIVREWLQRTLGNGAMTVRVGEEIRQFLTSKAVPDTILLRQTPSVLKKKIVYECSILVFCT